MQNLFGLWSVIVSFPVHTHYCVLSRKVLLSPTVVAAAFHSKMVMSLFFYQLFVISPLILGVCV